MSGRLTIWIDGREALPVRAIPYVTGWNKLTPDVVARYLAQDDTVVTEWHMPLSAFHYISGTPVAVAPRDWEGVAVKLKGLDAELCAMDESAGYAAWRERASLILPAGVWVWLDEFERMYQALDESMSFDDNDHRDNGLILAPMLATDTRVAVLEGFDNLHADPGSNIDEEAVDVVLGEREHKTGWYDATMNAALWLKRASVKPGEAAMLLWRLDPLERDWQGNPPDPERTFVDGNEESPDYYRALKRAFEDVAETDPKPRTLLDWRDVAKREGLRYHEWIDEYEQARIDELPADAGSKDDAVKVGAGKTASDVPPLLKKATTGKPATQEEIIKAFPIQGGWGDKLKKAPSGAYQWLAGTWAHVGSRKPGDATTYYPVKVAIALAASNPQRMTLGACDLVIRSHFPKWWGEWETESELLRKI